jgi:hypothetical protein
VALAANQQVGVPVVSAHDIDHDAPPPPPVLQHVDAASWHADSQAQAQAQAQAQDSHGQGWLHLASQQVWVLWRTQGQGQGRGQRSGALTLEELLERQKEDEAEGELFI